VPTVKVFPAATFQDCGAPSKIGQLIVVFPFAVMPAVAISTAS
jgi:hypothetical protein